MVRKLNFQTVPLADLSLKGRTQPAGLPKPIVLVVDDEAVIADTRAMILEHNGISTMVAYNGNSALEIAKTIHPDLLLADVAMPGMNGIDLAMAIRQIIPNCGILLFSGQASNRGFAGASSSCGTGIYYPHETAPSNRIARARVRRSGVASPALTRARHVVADQDQQSRLTIAKEL